MSEIGTDTGRNVIASGTANQRPGWLAAGGVIGAASGFYLISITPNRFE